MQVGQASANALLPARVDTMWAPGAAMSGFANPSWVVPSVDQSAGASSQRSNVPPSSTAPTEIANGSLPGAYSAAPSSAPRLPAAATTTMPLKYAASTAASSGSVRYDPASVELSDRLTTRML